MSEALVDLVRDPRLAPYAAAPAPAWLWTADATKLLWANAVAAALFNESSVPALAGRRFGPEHPASREVRRLVAGLPPSGAAQFARLRGFAPGRLLLCACSQIALADGAAAILIAASEPVGPVLSLAERARRLLQDQPGLAVFAADGTLLHAGPGAAEWLGDAGSLEALGVGDVAVETVASGWGAGISMRGPVTLLRIGRNDDTLLLATFADVTVPDPGDATDPAAAAALAAPAESSAAPTPEGSPPADTANAGEIVPAPEAGDSIEPAPLASERELPPPERRHPLRFVWEMDPDGRFTVTSDELTDLLGPQTAAALGRPWAEIAAELGLDPIGRVGRAIASRDTWSGVTVEWPADDTGERLPVSLSGLPVYAADRSFRGYRGFGVIRDVDRIAAVLAARRAAASGSTLPPPTRASVPEPRSELPVLGEAGQPVIADTEPPAEPPPDDDTAMGGPAAAAAPGDGRPQLTLVPSAKNVVPFRSPGPPPADKRPALSTVERSAFQEIARALGARLETEPSNIEELAEMPPDPSGPAEASSDPEPPDAGAQEPPAMAPPEAAAAREDDPPPPAARSAPAEAAEPRAPAASEAAPPPSGEWGLLDRLPLAVLVFRGDTLIHANRTFFRWTGFGTLPEFAAAGGLEQLFLDPVLAEPAEPDAPGRALAIRTRAGENLPVEGRLFTVPWEGETALLLMLTKAAADERARQAELAQRAAQGEARELKSILDTATDGVIVVDQEGRLLAGNRSAEALFGYEMQELTGRAFTDLFAVESHRAAADYLDGLMRSGVASILNDGREVIGRERQGGLIPLFMTMGRISEQPAKFCAVFRDITQWKRAEEELTTAKQQAERASSAKSDFLAKISHEIRTPLNAIIGFSEVMMQERFGPIGNERYREYLKDIHTSGGHLISLLSDLLDLSKIEAGKLDLTFARVDLNDATQQCVAIMQPQANRERIIIRTSLSPSLPPVVADTRSIRQIVLNLLSNSIKFTGPGGQVIVSTALTDDGEAVLRVRDTGIGMSEQDIATALEPFRQLATASPWGAAGGAGLGLPLTKALAEANRASFHIKSAVDSGTLVEIVFPATRVLAE